MGSVLSIDTLAQRYGLLPSELLERATTFDMWICNSAIRYQQVKEAESQGDFSHYSEEQLLAMKQNI